MANPIPPAAGRNGSRCGLRAALWLALFALCGSLGSRIALADGWQSARTPADVWDGYRLWLRYVPIHGAWLARYRASATEVVGPGPAGSSTAPGGAPPSLSPTLRAAQAELLRDLTGMLGSAPQLAGDVMQDGAILFGTPLSSPSIKALPLDLSRVGTEGYVIRTVTIQGHRATVIAANTDIGVLYGAFRFLRLLQTAAAQISRHPLAPGDPAPGPRPLGQSRTARSSAATRATRSGTGRSCRTISIRATPITPAPAPRSESTARC